MMHSRQSKKTTENMDNQIKHSPPETDSPPVSPPHELTLPESSPPHSKQNSEGHISLSPPPGALGNSPPRSSVSSDRTTITHGLSPEKDKPQSQGILPPTVVVNRAVLEDHVAVVTKTDRGGDEGRERRRVRPSLSILRSAKREKMVKRAALGFRVFGFLFCLVSFSVMAADRNQGWALDSFDRYIEFRYCVSVNVIGFLYSGAQAIDLTYNFASGKYIMPHQQQLRHYFDFVLDQMIAYLLISASSSATVRVDDWQSNWGKDKFPDMATASVSMSFLAFFALASSSLISGYSLCTSKSL